MFDVRWERQLHQAGSASALALAPGRLIVHERHTRLVSLDPADGSVRWDIPVGTWPRAVVIAGHRCLVIPQNTNQLLCLDLDTGERVWSVGLQNFTGHLVVTADTVLVGGWRGYTPLRALNAETGQLRWETDHRVHTVRPASTGHGFLIGEPGGTTVRLIDRLDARQLFAGTLPQPLLDYDNRSAFVAAGPDRFLVRCGRRTVAQIVPSAEMVSGFLNVERDLALVAPEYAGGLLWLPELRAGYTVMNPLDGCLLWRVDVKQHLVDQVIPLEEGFVLASTAGTLFHLDSRGQVNERVAVTQRIRALRSVVPDQLLLLTKGTLLATMVRNSATQK